MLFTRTFALARTTVRASPSSAWAVRAFSVAAPARRDIIKDLYLNEIRNYKAPANIAADTSSLVSAFAQPTAPAAPALEADVITYGEDAAAAEAEWPALVDPIEDHHFINGDFEIVGRLSLGKSGDDLTPKKKYETRKIELGFGKIGVWPNDVLLQPFRISSSKNASPGILTSFFICTDEWDFICRPDDGGVLFPKRLKPYDYSGDHH
ncbi:hypothetical protein HDU81_003944 [Chytriomyces hyalinus]|nr:hypothetical protein HDU81_003944 [Chytriomyces hyalinus]